MAYTSINDADLLTSLTGNEKIPISNGSGPAACSVNKIIDMLSDASLDTDAWQVGAISTVLDYVNDETEMNEAITLVNQING